MATIRDIARVSGSSIASVSRVLNDSGYVSEVVRAKIQAAIDELNYQPHAGARTMRSGQSRMIGLLLPSLAVEFFARIADQIERQLFERGYHTLICSTDEQVDRERAGVAALLAKQIDGAIVASVSRDGSHMAGLAQCNVPVVALDRPLSGVDSACVTADHAQGGRLAAAHLIALGHRRIVIVGAPEFSLPVAERARGALEVMAEAGIEPMAKLFGPLHDISACAALVAPVLEFADPPTAVLATSDLAAIGVLKAARRAGLRLPGDLSVTGFDDIPAASCLAPELTTVAQPIDQLAKAAVDTLLAAPDIPKQDRILPVELIVRESTAPPR